MHLHETLVLIGFLVMIAVFLAFDLGVFNKKDHEPGFKEALGYTAIWVILALIFWALIYFYGDLIHKPENLAQLRDLVKANGHPIGLTDSFEKSLQIYRQNLGLEFITNKIYDTWQNYIADFYEKPEFKDVALFLPCAAKKPYKFSKTHTLIRKTLKGMKNIHRIVISSPGVIPFEFNTYYPFNAYDWEESKETPEIMKEYIRINKERIIRYLKKHKYKHHVCYFKPTAESYIALKQACDELGIELKEVLVEKPMREENLAKLRKVLTDLQ